VASVRLVLQMQRPQDADAWQHGVASALYDEHQRSDRCLQFRHVVFTLRQLGDVIAGIA
jgi:hypothetical protein